MRSEGQLRDRDTCQSLTTKQFQNNITPVIGNGQADRRSVVKYRPHFANNVFFFFTCQLNFLSDKYVSHLHTSVNLFHHNVATLYIFQVLTTVLNKQSLEGFGTIVLKLASSEVAKLSEEHKLLSYQWLEHIAMYASQAAANPAFAQGFLKVILCYSYFLNK